MFEERDQRRVLKTYEAHAEWPGQCTDFFRHADNADNPDIWPPDICHCPEGMKVGWAFHPLRFAETAIYAILVPFPRTPNEIGFFPSNKGKVDLAVERKFDFAYDIPAFLRTSASSPRDCRIWELYSLGVFTRLPQNLRQVLFRSGECMFLLLLEPHISLFSSRIRQVVPERR